MPHILDTLVGLIGCAGWSFTGSLRWRWQVLHCPMICVTSCYSLASNISVEAHYRQLKFESDLKDAHLKPGRNVLSVEVLRHTKYCHMIDDTTAYQVHTCNEVFSLLHFCISAHLLTIFQIVE
jgi:hypothetical protein